ncbi:MAG: DUF1840 family protein [Duodenibacillus sp.]|nr:DUF1840 family protein [Duodenibacillus sp.]
MSALLEFRCRAAGGFFLMPGTFKEICELLGRPYAESGCWTWDALEPMLAVLVEEIERERERDDAAESARLEAERTASYRYLSYEEEERLMELEAVRRARVSFGRRAFPLVEMMREAIRQEEDITWGIPY